MYVATTTQVAVPLNLRHFGVGTKMAGTKMVGTKMAGRKQLGRFQLLAIYFEYTFSKVLVNNISKSAKRKIPLFTLLNVRRD